MSGVENIAYVLVARKWDADSWLIVPFSMYSSPATDTELQVKVNGGVGLRVLQLWNARSLLTQTLEKSWLVHVLSDEDLADAFTAWQWSVGVGELSDDQLAVERDVALEGSVKTEIASSADASLDGGPL